MIKIPEAAVLSMQINKIVAGKKITNVIASHSPNKFACSIMLLNKLLVWLILRN